ncbi:ECF transporter S component [uncultured Leifsonia sp.]|uniref:ECF transporter S component n=1 Tax=uncultured Leifsonia sp. TaxID=340359 RepID=UPI0028D62A0E|nr:ECF transporter S component [uncultured Leifsonia sp.]
MTNTSTRLLLTCAAIGVAGGIVFSVSAYISGTLAAAAPMFYGAVIGVYFLPGVVAQSLLRRGGVALITSVIAGLVSVPFQPIGFMAVMAAGSIGLMQEIPFAITLYRYWRAWLFYLAVTIAGLVFGLGVFVAQGAEQAAPWVQVVHIGLFVVSPILFTWIGRVVAKGLDRTGAGRGLQLPIVRPRQRRDRDALPMTAA